MIKTARENHREDVVGRANVADTLGRVDATRALLT
jgi:hypothetical protein